ncbi:MAG: glycosyltransferase family 4 protein, partial [Pseudomonadota bacterium]
MQKVMNIDEFDIASATMHRSVVKVLIHRRLDDSLSGSAVYLLACLNCLEEAGFQVELVIAPVAGFGSKPFSIPSHAFKLTGRSIRWPGTIRVGRVYVSINPAVWVRAWKRVLNQIAWILKGRKEFEVPAIPSSLGKPPSPADQKAMIAEVNSSDCDVALAEYSSLAGLLGKCRAEKRAVLLHDLFSERGSSFVRAGLTPDHETITLEDECQRLEHVDLCIHASVKEAQLLCGKLPNRRHVWLPPKAAVQSLPEQGPLRLVFIGVRHGGNQDALKMILENIWPEIYKQRPETELWIVGEISDVVHRHHPGVKVLGRVEDLCTVGGPSAIGLAPERAVSGISIKVTTYLNLGMSVLTTPDVLEAYGHALDDLVETAEDTKQFVDRAIALLDDRDARLKRAEQVRGMLHYRL